MRFNELDWSIFTSEYIDERVQEIVTKYTDKKYDEKRVSRYIVSYLTNHMNNAVLLGEMAAAIAFFNKLVDHQKLVIGNYNISSEMIAYISKRGRASENIFFKNCPGLILVAREKYGDRYFDLSTPENTARAVCFIANERLQDGYYRTDADYAKNDQPDLFQKPEETLYQKIDRLLYISKDKSKLVWAAFYIMQELIKRDEYEYERIEIEAVNTPEWG